MRSGSQDCCRSPLRRLLWAIPLHAFDDLAEPTYDPVAPGDVVAGRYRVERTIAVGGMGVVVAAKHEDLDKPVALKILRPEILGDETAVTRFTREARIAAKLQNEHVARVFDVGTTESGVPYMAMELLRGLDMQQLVDAHGPLSVTDTVDYALQALEAIAEAHAQGIVHRDLKPSNIFIAQRSDGSNTVKVLDFGISKGNTGIHAPADAKITNSRSIIGSPGYMSPEQMRSASGVDGRTDLWSLGVILYEVLTGEMLFKGETVGAIMIDILQAPIQPLSERRSDVPAELDRVILKCLERDQDKRWADAAELAHALAPFGSSWSRISVERVSALLGRGPTLDTPRLHPPSDEKRRLHSQTASTFSATHAEPRPRRAFLVTAGILMTAAGVGLGLWAHGRGTATNEPAPTPATTGVATDATGSLMSASVKTDKTEAPTEATSQPTAASAIASATATPTASATANPPPVKPHVVHKKRKPVDILGERQ